jgi:predicted Zn-dependent protease
MSPAGRLEPASVVVERALRAGGRDTIVLVEDRSTADIRFANNTTTTNGVHRDRSVTVIAIVDRPDGRAFGVASESGVGDVDALAASARRAAEDATAAEDEATLFGAHVDDDFADPAETTDLTAFGPLLPELAEAFGRARSADRRLAGFASHDVSTLYLGTTAGVRRRHTERTGSLELVARSADGERSSWAGVGGATFDGVSLSAMEARLVERLGWAERRIELPPGRYDVLLPPDAVADLVIELYESLGGRDAEDGGTAFSAPGGGTRLGERLFDLPFTLSSDPSATGIECQPFLATGGTSSQVSVFDNGAPLAPTNWIEGGVLSRLNYHRAGAAASEQLFSPPIDNLSLALPGASATLDKLVAGTARGLLLTCLWYIREVDPATLLLTGLTRDGVYLVEHGEVVGAVNNFRFNESPLDLLRDTLAVGASERALSREWGEWMNRTAMPPLLVGGFNMSSASQAS